LGFVLVDLYLVSWQRRPTQGVGWDVLGFAAWPLVFYALNAAQAGGTTMIASYLALPWVLLVAYVSAFRGVITRRVLRWPPIYIVGGMCYSIYLYHGYVLEAVVALQKRYAMTGHYWVDTFAGLGAIACAVLLSCGTLFALFEKPFMNPRWHLELWDRIAGRARAAPRAAAEQASE
jgi:peptidoglycan/LPS O-acetylase OafA/YrhL